MGKHNKQVCQGCSSTKRRLVPLVTHRQLLYRILGEDTRQAKAAVLNLTKGKRSLCWECNQILLNTYKFQQKVLKTQLMLTSYKRKKEDDENDSSLSTLKVFFKDGYDCIELYKDPFDCPPPDVKPKIEDNDENKYETEMLDDVFDDIESECSDDYFPEDKGKAKDDIFNDEVPGRDDDTDKDKSDDENDAIKEQSNDMDPGPKESESEAESEPPKKVKKVEKKKKSDDEDEDYEPSDCIKEAIRKKTSRKGEASVPNAQYRRVDCKIENIRTKFSKVPMDRNNYFALLVKYKNSKEYFEAKYKCERCVLEFFNEELLNCHMIRHDWKKSAPYKCDICDTYWETDDQLNVHYRNQHMFKLECTLCGEQFLRKRLLFLHQDERHNLQVECLQCGRKFVDRTAFWKHNREIHTKFTCDHCGATFRSKILILRHLRLVHRPLKCDICSKIFKKRFNLQLHTKVKHTKTDSERCYCVECDIQFLNKYQFEAHLKKTLKHGGAKPRVPCPVCGKEFSEQMRMNNHYKYYHLKQYDYKCLLCHKNFVSKSHLKRHKQRVHDERKVPPVKDKFCEYCGRGFSVNKTLIHHIRTHTGERPYKCEFCTNTFAQSFALVTHTRKIHNMPDYRRATTSQ